MSLPLPAPAAGASPAVEARGLFDRMRALAAAALEAVERGDEVTIRRALDERDRLAERITPLVREIGRAHARSSAEAASVLEAALALQEADAGLAARLAEARAGVARALDRMGHAESAAAAYAPPAGAARLDLLR
ncbi:MAG TPA: hypothetical protein VF263_12255 [Longimicrobiaceae bacterium]